MSLADNVRKYVENRENAMIEDIEAISGDTCGETIRLNDDLVTINQSQIRRIVKEVLTCNNAEIMRRQFSELCIQYRDIWIKVKCYRGLYKIKRWPKLSIFKTFNCLISCDLINRLENMRWRRI